MLTLNYIHFKTGQQLMHFPCIEAILLKRCAHQVSAKKLYQILGVEENCEDETLRLAFVHLAKRFHPDSGTPEASALRFSEIEGAYREIKRIRNDQREQEGASTGIEEFDIKHTAPQHRHYLTHNVGVGSPSKRQRLYTMERAQRAVDNVMEHRLKKLQADERNTLVGMDKQYAKDIKTRFGMDRLVEDLIQEAMNKGEFSDLPGMGKPLKDNASSQNPYVDFVTHKLNQVLIENGFIPEWIQLSKDIREKTKEIKNELIKERSKLGPIPLSDEETEIWENTVESFRTSTKTLNNKIDKYNLLVPILQKQMLHVKLEALAEEALTTPVKQVKKESPNYVEYPQEDIFTSIFKFFSSKRTA